MQSQVFNFHIISTSIFLLFGTEDDIKKWNFTRAQMKQKDQYSLSKQKQSSIYIYVNKLNFKNCLETMNTIQLLKLDFPVDARIYIVLCLLIGYHYCAKIIHTQTSMNII